MDTVVSFKNRSDVQSSAIPSTINVVLIQGYDVQWDAPIATYVRVAVEPEHEGKFKSQGNAWWRLDPQGTSVDVRWFGAKMDSGIDGRTALVNAINAVTPPSFGEDRLSVRTVFIPKGILKVSGTSVMVRGVTIQGTGPNTTIVMFTDNNAVGFFFDGGSLLALSTPSAAAEPWFHEVSGGGLQSIAIWMLANTAGLYGVLLQGDQYRQPDECVFEDVKITGGGTWALPIYINGSQRVPDTAPNPRWAIGLRRTTLRNVFIGNAVAFGLSALSVQELTMLGVGIYGGTSQAMMIDGTSVLPSNNVQLLGCNIQTTLYVFRCNGMNVSSYCASVVFATGAKGCGFYGTLAGGTYSSIPSAGNLNNAAIL